MKAYKGFDKNMRCRGFQFEEGKTYEEERAELCKAGFHACENPIDVFRHYAPGESVFREVELEDVSDMREADSKVCGKKIKIGAEISLRDMIRAGVKIDIQTAKRPRQATAALRPRWATTALRPRRERNPLPLRLDGIPRQNPRLGIGLCLRNMANGMAKHIRCCA